MILYLNNTIPSAYGIQVPNAIGFSGSEHNNRGYLYLAGLTSMESSDAMTGLAHVLFHAYQFMIYGDEYNRTVEIEIEAALFTALVKNAFYIGYEPCFINPFDERPEAQLYNDAIKNMYVNGIDDVNFETAAKLFLEYSISNSNGLYDDFNIYGKKYIPVLGDFEP